MGEGPGASVARNEGTSFQTLLLDSVSLDCLQSRCSSIYKDGFPSHLGTSDGRAGVTSGLTEGGHLDGQSHQTVSKGGQETQPKQNRGADTRMRKRNKHQ